MRLRTISTYYKSFLLLIGLRMIIRLLGLLRLSLKKLKRKDSKKLRLEVINRYWKKNLRGLKRKLKRNDEKMKERESSSSKILKKSKQCSPKLLRRLMTLIDQLNWLKIKTSKLKIVQISFMKIEISPLYFQENIHPVRKSAPL